MFLSRILSHKRIASGVRPSFKAAWAPVAFDIVIIALVLAALWGPALTFIFVVLMVLIYAPLQIVIIVSTIAAVRSRWEEKEIK